MSQSANFPSAITFTVPLPPSVNNLFPTGRDGRRYTSGRYKAWKEKADLLAMAQLRHYPVRHIPGEVEVHYELSFGDGRRRDVGNYDKALSDFLVRHGLIEDDSLISKLTIEKVRASWFGARVTLTARGNATETV